MQSTGLPEFSVFVTPYELHLRPEDGQVHLISERLTDPSLPKPSTQHVYSHTSVTICTIYTKVCVHIYIYICVCVCVFTNVYMHEYVYTYVYV